MNSVEPIRNPQKIREIQEALEKKSVRDRVLFDIGITTGLRVSDILPLTVGDVRGKTELTLTEKKTERSVTVDITGMVEELMQYTQGMGDAEYLFPSRRGGSPITRVQAYRIISEAAKAAGLGEIGTHTMRKTFAHNNWKTDCAKVEKQLNHKPDSSILMYLGITEADIDEALADFEL